MKQWYASKTLWLNVIAGLALIVQTRTGFIIDPEAQGGLLAIINLILRAITKDPLGWSASSSDQSSGFIRPHLLAVLCALSLLSVLCLQGCATTGTTTPAPNDSPQVLAGKSLLAVKSTIVTAATATDALCRAGKMPADKCAQAKTAYELAKPGYDAAVDAYLLMTSMGGDPGDFAGALQHVQGLAVNLLAVTGGAK